MNKKIYIVITLVLIIVAAGTFYGGMKYGQAKRDAFAGMNFQNLSDEQKQQMQQGNFSRNRQAGTNAVMGEIISKDDKSITIKLPDNGSKIIFFAEATEVTKSAEGTLDDLIVGQNVTINGSNNQDGSMTGASIQLRSFASLGSTPGTDEQTK
jgi:hypothetical protein